MDNFSKTTSKLTHTAFLNRENDFRHLSYDDEMQQYELLKRGDHRFVEVCRRSFQSGQLGRLSDDPLRNKQYLFICFITLATRFCVEGGLSHEQAYTISDVYIQRVDHCKTVREVDALHLELLHYYDRIMSGIAREKAYSRPVIQCMDYIYNHLHENIRLKDMAAWVGKNSSYLSALFKKELGMGVTGYIQAKKIELARNMLKYSDYSYVDISNYLAFSSHSYFISVFKKHTGLTPKQYREAQFRTSLAKPL